MIARFLDFLYPALCELCQISLKKGSSICSSCVDNLPRIKDPICQRCGESFDGNLGDDFRCQNCLGLSHDFVFARASFKGLATPFHLVHSLKYRKRFFLARDLAPLLLETLDEDSRFEEFRKNTLLVPVPLHWRRQQWRQGNQAFELARELSKVSGIPYANSLRRIRSTQTQTKLNRKQRLSNLRGAFAVKKRHREQLRGTNIILIDDVFTTGATAHECTRILRHSAKSSKVAVLTLVRG
jgi:ComF family protein